MSYFLLNILFAGGWMLMNGTYTSLDFVIGFGVGYLILWLTQPFGAKTVYFTRLRATINLVVYFFYELLISSIEVVWDVLTPRHMSKPDIISVPLTAETDLEITLLANLVSLTPGTLSLDVSPDRKYLIIHAMFVKDQDKIIQSIKQGMEKKLLEVIRGESA